MSAVNNEIIINLDTLESTDVLDRKDLIFQEQYDQLVDKIRRKARENKVWLAKKKRGENERHNDEARGVPSCFFIDGTRGSGKSTLMRAVRAELTECKDSEERLYPLADIDPTELGHGENFFLYLLGRIYKLIEEHYKKYGERDEEVEKVRNAMEDLRKMSGGLQVLMDSDGALKKSGTPEFFLEESIDKCADSMSLRKKLCELLDKVAASIRNEIFLVTIDDADLNFSKCEDVLEYVRKYMQSPRLIFLFAGDMQLYSHVVRGMHINNFSDKLLNNDTSHAAHRQQMVDRLEDQYLLKLFPVDHRVQTHGLKKILEENRELYIKRYDGDEKKLSWKAFIRVHFKQGIRLVPETMLTETLLQMPMRSVFFFLRYLANTEQSQSTQEILKYIWDGIQEVFLPSLVKYNVDYMQLGNENIELLQKSIFRYLAATQRWYSDLSMQPTEADIGAKQVSLYLSGTVGKSTQRLSSKLKYWCACFPAWHAVRELYVQTYDSMQAQNLIATCLKQGTGRSGVVWANLACASLAKNSASPVSFGLGTICLLNEDRHQDNERGWEYRRGVKSLLKTFSEGNFSAQKNVKRYAWALSACLCRIDDDYNAYYCLSVYHLLATIADWLDFGLKTKQDIEDELKRNSHDVSVDLLYTKLRAAVAKRLKSSHIIPNTLRLLRVETGDHDAVNFERLNYFFAGISDEELVDQMVEWLKWNINASFITSSIEYSDSWKIFMAKCRNFTVEYKMEYDSDEFCPKAGSILQQYMKAFEVALESLMPSDNRRCITTFPMWKILSDEGDTYKEAKELLNSAYIGDVINLKNKAKLSVLKDKCKRISAQITDIKERKKKAEVKQSAICDIRINLLRERDNTAAEKKLRNEKLRKIDAEQKKLGEEIQSCMMVESELQQKSLDAREEGLKVQYKKVQEKYNLLKEVLSGAYRGQERFVYLDKEMDRIQGLLDRAKTEATRQKHEMSMEVIQEVRRLLERETKEEILKVDVWRDVTDEKNRVGSDYYNLIRGKQELKIQEQNMKNVRFQKEKELAIMISHNEPLRKQAFETEIAYEIASMKCERIDNEVEEIKKEVAKLDKELAETLNIYDEAKKEYEDKKIDRSL